MKIKIWQDGKPIYKSVEDDVNKLQKGLNNFFKKKYGKK